MKASLRAGNITSDSDSTVSMNKQFDALERISKNIHFNKYPRTRQSTATGLTSDQCNILLSEESLKYFATKSSGLLGILKPN